MKAKKTFTALSITSLMAIISLVAVSIPSPLFAAANSKSTESQLKNSAWSKDAIVVNMKTASGTSVGTATITLAQQNNGKGISIQLDLHGLPAGTHAIHIHNKASCIGPDFKSAGDHFSPAHHKHGKVEGGQHEGDLPNIVVAADGNLKTTLESEHSDADLSTKSLRSGAGTSLVIHEKADDYKTQPSGDSGSRIVCGEIAPVAK